MQKSSPNETVEKVQFWHFHRKRLPLRQPGGTVACSRRFYQGTRVCRPGSGFRHSRDFAEVSGQRMAPHGEDCLCLWPIGRSGWGAPAGLTIARAVGNPTQLWKTHLAFGHLHATLKQPEAAHQAYGATCDIIERVKGSLRDPGLRASLESSPLMRRVYDLCAS